MYKTVKDFINSLGNHIAMGTSHKVFENPDNVNTVIKIGREVLEQARIFKTNEDLFPKVYKIVNCGNVNENYIIVEKLFCESVESDLTIVFKKLAVKKNLTSQDFIDSEKYYSNVNKLELKYLSLFERIKEISLFINMSDITPTNFGYDRTGKLKALDI